MAQIIYNGELEKLAHKEIFGKTMEEIANADSAVVYLDCDLMNSIGTLKFWHNNKKQAINCGIAEANAAGVACGLAAVGKKPYMHTFAPFASRRCFDQIFISGAYAKNSIRVFGSDAGITAAFNGGTHMPFEDMALMRAIPDATVIDISDGTMLKSILHAIKDREGVTYFRSTRKNFRQIYGEDTKFEIGKGIVTKEGTDVTIIASGLMVGESMAAAEMLKSKGISARVVDMFTVKPIDRELVIKCAKETGAIVTAENHNIIGGLGDAVSAVIVKECLVPVEKVGVLDRFGEVGPQSYLQEVFHLMPEDVVKACEDVIKRK